MNEDYWAWQAYVGLIHMKRQATNPMMLGQAFMIQDFVRQRIADPELAGAVSRLMATVGAIIACGYEKAHLPRALRKLPVSGGAEAPRVTRWGGWDR